MRSLLINYLENDDLVGMNERVSQMGGVLKVESDPVRGTRLRVDLPLPNASADSGELSS